MSQREAWFASQTDLDPARLVFIDETWATTNMMRSHGRSRRGERLRMGYPHGHRKTTTLVAGLRRDGMVAPMVLDGPINGDWFEAYVRQILIPDLKAGDIVIMDNLSSHKRSAVQAMIDAAGAELRFLPPYTARTSIPLRTHSPSSRPFCERPQSGPSMDCGTPSAISSTSSLQKNAPTTSPPQGTMQIDRAPL
jgi:hypothetical protein